VLTGGNGLADTPDPARGDDVRVILVGHAAPNAPVIRCGPNQVAETTANNERVGDDIQLIPVGAPCPNANAVVVDSGADGIAQTRAQGADLALVTAAPNPVGLVIRRRKSTATKRVKVVVENREFGAAAPLSRAYVLSVDDGSCPNGTVSAVDADAHAPGIQQSSAVRLRGRVKGTFLVTLRLEDVTSVDRKIPFRCAVTATAEAIDTAPSADDAVNPGNNAMRIDIEAIDENDFVKARRR
jgi:hypothetical protein